MVLTQRQIEKLRPSERDLYLRRQRRSQIPIISNLPDIQPIPPSSEGAFGIIYSRDENGNIPPPSEQAREAGKPIQDVINQVKASDSKEFILNGKYYNKTDAIAYLEGILKNIYFITQKALSQPPVYTPGWSGTIYALDEEGNIPSRVAYEMSTGGVPVEIRSLGGEAIEAYHKLTEQASKEDWSATQLQRKATELFTSKYESLSDQQKLIYLKQARGIVPKTPSMLEYGKYLYEKGVQEMMAKNGWTKDQTEASLNSTLAIEAFLNTSLGSMSFYRMYISDPFDRVNLRTYLEGVKKGKWSTPEEYAEKTTNIPYGIIGAWKGEDPKTAKANDIRRLLKELDQGIGTSTKYQNEKEIYRQAVQHFAPGGWKESLEKTGYFFEDPTFTKVFTSPTAMTLYSGIIAKAVGFGVGTGLGYATSKGAKLIEAGHKIGGRALKYGSIGTGLGLTAYGTWETGRYLGMSRWQGNFPEAVVQTGIAWKGASEGGKIGYAYGAKKGSLPVDPHGFRWMQPKDAKARYTELLAKYTKEGNQTAIDTLKASYKAYGTKTPSQAREWIYKQTYGRYEPLRRLRFEAYKPPQYRPLNYRTRGFLGEYVTGGKKQPLTDYMSEEVITGKKQMTYVRGKSGKDVLELYKPDSSGRTMLVSGTTQAQTIPKMQVKVRAIIVKDGKYGVMSHIKGKLKSLLLFGGDVKPGETNKQALARELIEEGGVKIKSSKRLFHIVDAQTGEKHIFYEVQISGSLKKTGETTLIEFLTKKEILNSKAGSIIPGKGRISRYAYDGLTKYINKDFTSVGAPAKKPLLGKTKEIFVGMGERGYNPEKGRFWVRKGKLGSWMFKTKKQPIYPETKTTLLKTKPRQFILETYAKEGEILRYPKSVRYSRTKAGDYLKYWAPRSKSKTQFYVTAKEEIGLKKFGIAEEEVISPPGTVETIRPKGFQFEGLHTGTKGKLTSGLASIKGYSKYTVLGGKKTPIITIEQTPVKPISTTPKTKYKPISIAGKQITPKTKTEARILREYSDALRGVKYEPIAYEIPYELSKGKAPFSYYKYYPPQREYKPPKTTYYKPSYYKGEQKYRYPVTPIIKITRYTEYPKYKKTSPVKTVYFDYSGRARKKEKEKYIKKKKEFKPITREFKIFTPKKIKL